VDYDWCEVENVSGFDEKHLQCFIEVGQTVWLQDLPHLDEPDLRQKSETTFAGSLQYILNNVALKPALVRLTQTVSRSMTVPSHRFCANVL
jgi:hypothetical protein